MFTERNEASNKSKSVCKLCDKNEHAQACPKQYAQNLSDQWRSNVNVNPTQSEFVCHLKNNGWWKHSVFIFEINLKNTNYLKASMWQNLVEQCILCLGTRLYILLLGCAVLQEPWPLFTTDLCSFVSQVCIIRAASVKYLNMYCVWTQLCFLWVEFASLVSSDVDTSTRL
jgi:hypothetical protein